MIPPVAPNRKVAPMSSGATVWTLRSKNDLRSLRGLAMASCGQTVGRWVLHDPAAPDVLDFARPGAFEGSMKPPSQRQLRAGELVRHALMDILAREEFDDPDLHGKSITITEVRASPDLKHATAFAAPLGGEDMAKTVDALNRAAGFLRGRLSKEVDMRYTPQLRFIADDSYDEARRIDQLLSSDRVRRDLDRKIGD
jgi:ribosome-binding factor A